MKTLVTYMSKTGNTKKIADAIYGEINGEKEIKSIDQIKDLNAYDLVFAGFPVHNYGPDKKAKKFLENKVNGKKIALFITHSAPEDHPEVPEYLQKFKDAAAQANLINMFNCQGELAKGIKFIMSVMPDKKLRTNAKMDDSKGQPDISRIEKARLFANETFTKLSA